MILVMKELLKEKEVSKILIAQFKYDCRIMINISRKEKVKERDDKMNEKNRRSGGERSRGR